MADDQTNPYVTMGMAGMMMPNPYTQYKGALPMPGFRGTPTDAQGKPIQSFLDAQAQHDAWNAANPAPAQGTTLNSLPAGGSQAPPYDPPTVYGGANPNAGGGWGSVYQGVQRQPQTMGAPRQQAQPAPAPQNPIDMRQAYLDALANPGKVTTPGATVQPSKPLGTPNVLDAFLANHPSGPAAPAGGGYSNKPFFDTLAQLRSA